MDFNFEVNNAPVGGGGGGGSVTQVGTGPGLTGGPITTIGTISFATTGSGLILANITGGTAVPSPNTLSDILDAVFDDTQGDLIYRSGADWTYLPAGTPGYFLQTNGAASDPSWAVPPGGAFNPQDTLYFAIGGDDGNSGVISEPLLTLNQAVINAQALIVGGATSVSIIGLGVGIDTSNVSITLSGIDIYAPGFQLNPVAGDALTVNITTGSDTYINVVLSSSTVAGGAKAVNLINTIPGSYNVTSFKYYGAVFGDVYLNEKCEFFSTVIAGLLTVNQHYSNVVVLYGISSHSYQTILNIQGMLFGANGGNIYGPVNATDVWRYPMRKIIYLSGSIALTNLNSGYLFINSTTNNYTITLPDTTGQGTPAFLIGYEATFLNLSTGSIIFTAAGSATLIGANSLTAVAQRANCTLTTANVWEVDAAGGTVTQVNSGTGLTGGPITSTGTLSLAPITNNFMLANISGASNPPLPHTVSDVLDSAFTNTQGSILYRNNAVWSYLIPGTVGYFLRTGGAGANPSWAASGGGGPSHLWQETYWVAQNGNDANNGLSIDTPKLTLAGVQAVTSPGVATAINIPDAGTYVANNFAVKGITAINAPGATFVSGGSSIMFAINSAAALLIDFAEIVGTGTQTAFYSTSGSPIVANGSALSNVNFAWQDIARNVPEAVFNINVIDSGIFNFGDGDTIQSIKANRIGQISVNSNCTNPVTITADSFDGTFNDGGSAIYCLNFASTGLSFVQPTIGKVYGNFGNPQADFGRIVNNNSVYGEIYGVSQHFLTTAPYTVTPFDANMLIVIANAVGTIPLTLPDYATFPNIPLYSRFYFLQVYDTSPAHAHFSVNGIDILNAVDGTYTRAGIVEAILTVQSESGPDFQRTWTLSGALANNSSYTGPNFYISQLNGSDITGDGSPDKEFASINGALAYVIANFTVSPPNRINLFITDDEIYTEQVDFSATSNINLIGREAIIASTGSGSTITTNTSSMLVFVAEIGGSGGAIAMDLQGSVLGNIDVIAGDITNNSASDSKFDCFILNGDITNPGGGNISYLSITRSGSDDANTTGMTISGTSGDFNVQGVLSVNGSYSFPGGDGTAGQAMVTTGAGNVNFQTLGFSPYISIPGTSQLASVNTGYIISNAALTTVTLPNTMVTGSVVALQGYGAAGWSLVAGAGQVIHGLGGDTTIGGSLSSTAATDTVMVIAVVDNSEWSVFSVGGAGLTVA